MKRQNITDTWFFSSPHTIAKGLTIFVKGDSIILMPFFALVALVGFYSIKLMLLIFAIFFTLRSLGEMMYWFFQQFYDLKYRPHDFGFTKLSNKAIYILYQLFTLCMTTFGISAILYILYFWA